MSDTTRACPTCGAPTPASDLPEVAMEDGAVLVRVRGLAVGTCPDGHVSMLPADGAARAATAVHEQLLTARQRGVVRRRDHCGSCDVELVMPPRRTDTPVPFDADGQVVTVIVEAPMARCTACGLEQLPSAVERRVRAALRACIDAAQQPA